MVLKARTSLYTGSFTVSAPKLWNTFPTTVKQATFLNTIKRALVEYIFLETSILLMITLLYIPTRTHQMYNVDNKYAT